MSSTPFSAAALRGAIDLSGLKSRPSRAAGGPSGAARPGAVPVLEVTDATFQQAVATTTSVAAVLVLYSGAIAESADFVDVVVQAAGESGGRLQVMTADIDSALAIRQAFQVQSVPMVFGLVQARPVPLFGGVYSREEVAAVLGQLIELATQEGVTGTVAAAEPDGEHPAISEEQLSPHHETAFAAIESGDFEAARAAYERALADDPDDEEARLGIAQVGLLQRTTGIELRAAREAAAERPNDVDAQLLVADLDVLGGHIEDAFVRLVELVRRTAGPERDRVRTHLIGLFEVVGPADERVRKGRTALMSALF
ncbi:MAG: co-chaperone YbbN [Dermatophilaceae bacterium]|nr:tetratricopeptide repeat protein [Intrasporangiaceae bacterium]